jgi:hypothetical protein
MLTWLQRPLDDISDLDKYQGAGVTDILDVQDLKRAPLASGEKEDEETRRIVKKIDLRLLPVLATIYAFALIDRVNLPNVSSPPSNSVFQLLTQIKRHA